MVYSAKGHLVNGIHFRNLDEVAEYYGFGTKEALRLRWKKAGEDWSKVDLTPGSRDRSIMIGEQWYSSYTEASRALGLTSSQMLHRYEKRAKKNGKTRIYTKHGWITFDPPDPEASR